MAREWRGSSDEDIDLEDLRPVGPTPGKSSLSARLSGVMPISLLREAAGFGGPLMRKANGNAVGPNAAQAISRASSGSGRPLPADPRNGFAQSLGVDLDAVRIHTGASAASAASAVSARAFTVGNDIYFGEGQYDPTSRSGKELLAHEVVHTVQQSGGSSGAQFKLEVSQPGDALELEADRLAADMVAGRPAQVSGSGVTAAARKIMRWATEPQAQVQAAAYVRNAITSAQTHRELQGIEHALNEPRMSEGGLVTLMLPGEPDITIVDTDLPLLQSEAARRRGELPPQHGAANDGLADEERELNERNQRQLDEQQGREQRLENNRQRRNEENRLRRDEDAINQAIDRAGSVEERRAVLRAIQAGATPRDGLHHITLPPTSVVARGQEVVVRDPEYGLILERARTAVAEAEEMEAGRRRAEGVPEPGPPIDVEVQETQPEAPEHADFAVRDIAEETYRWSRSIIQAERAGLNSFETAINNESSAEAAPASVGRQVLDAVVTRTIQAMSSAISALPGGALARRLADLNRDLGRIQAAEEARVEGASARNAAAHFIIHGRTILADALTALDTQSVRHEVAVQTHSEGLASDDARRSFRQVVEAENQGIRGIRERTGNQQQVLARLTQEWINRTRSQEDSYQRSRVIIHMTRDWTVERAHLDAPFGSRLAEMLRRNGSLNLRDMRCRRVVRWYPMGSRSRMISAVIPPTNDALNELRVNGLSASYREQFIENMRTRPIPDATRITGTQTSD